MILCFLYNGAIICYLSSEKMPELKLNQAGDYWFATHREIHDRNFYETK